jgi:CheY-like chemotaxis protein
MDGIAVATELRADPATREIPIFAVSAEKFNESDVRRLRLLTQGIFPKEEISQARGMKIDLSGQAKVTFQE